MKKTQKYNILLLIWLLSLPIITFANAKDKPDYVGINENDVIIWKTTIDEDPFEDFLEDAGLTEAEIDIYMDDNPLFDDEFDDDVEGWKIVIMEIRDEKEYDLDDKYPHLDDDDYKAINYLYNLHITENFEANDWEEEETNEREKIYKYDKDLYVEFIEVNYPCRGLLALIISKNVNWKRVISEMDDVMDDDYEDAGAKKPKTTFMFYFEREVDGIVTYRDLGEDSGYNDDIDEFEATSIYTDDGILKYYEWSYDGDPIYIFELQDFFENYIIANLWEILIISAVALVIVVVVVIFIKRR